MICGTWIHTGCEAEVECDDCCCCPNHCHCGHEYIERLKAKSDRTVTVDEDDSSKSFQINKGA